MRLLKYITLLCIIFSFLLTSIVYAEEPIKTNSATVLNANAIFTLNGNKSGLSSLSDQSLYTKLSVDSGDTIKISSEKPISSIYVMFNKAPAPWYLHFSENRSLQGQYGFLHNFFEFPETQTEISLNFEATAEICDIYLYSEGILPSHVERWEPPCEKADILLLPTHADDEHLFFGGIMPYYAGELQKNVQVAYLTNHNGEWYRPHELLAGLWKVGVKNYPIIPKFNDYYSESLTHAKTLYDIDEMREYQVELLRRFRPNVVIAHDVDGEYGHGVHQLNTYLLMQALELSANETAFPTSLAEYGAYNVPKTYIHLYPINPVVLNYDIPLQNFDGKTAFQMAEEGFALHKSQTQYFKVEQNGKYDCRKFGLYRTLVGYDTVENNLLQNLEKIQSIETNVSSQPTEESSSPEVSSNETSSESIPPKTTRGLNGIQSSCLVIAGLLIAIFSLNRINRKNYPRSKKYRK